MPRSVNAVASRARRKKLMKQAKGFSVEERTFGLLLKTRYKKQCNMLTVEEKRKRETSEAFG